MCAYSVGANSAVDAIIMASVVLFPRARLQLLAFTLPVPAAVIGLTYVLLDCAGVISERTWSDLQNGAIVGGFDSHSASHIAASALGLITGLYFRRYFRL